MVSISRIEPRPIQQYLLHSLAPGGHLTKSCVATWQYNIAGEAPTMRMPILSFRNIHAKFGHILILKLTLILDELKSWATFSLFFSLSISAEFFKKLPDETRNGSKLPWTVFFVSNRNKMSKNLQFSNSPTKEFPFILTCLGPNSD